MAPDDAIQAPLESMIGARCGKLSGLVCELNEEMAGLAKDCLRFAAECPELRPFAADVGTRALTSAVEITAVVTRLAEHVARRAQADRGDYR